MTTAELRELSELVERYAQAVDHADAAAVAELFAVDGELVLFMDPGKDKPTGHLRGRDQITDSVARIGRYVATHHTISSHTAAVDGTMASGETMCTAHHVSDDGGARRDHVLYIRYVDTFVRATEGWQFRQREVRVQWASTLPVD